jgi:hypothetical protein
MAEPRISKPITVTQVVGMLALVLIVFFVGAFASKAVETYRLRMWLSDMEQEIAAMERQRESLELELQRRESKAWIDQALKETGRVPPDVLVVRVMPSDAAAPAQAEAAALAPTRPAFSTPALDLAEDGLSGPLFGNPNWKAWMALFLNRD